VDKSAVLRAVTPGGHPLITAAWLIGSVALVVGVATIVLGGGAIAIVFTVGGTLEWTQAAATSTYVDRNTNALVYCVTKGNLNVQADKFPAPVRTRCAP